VGKGVRVVSSGRRDRLGLVTDGVFEASLAARPSPLTDDDKPGATFPFFFAFDRFALLFLLPWGMILWSPNVLVPVGLLVQMWHRRKGSHPIPSTIILEDIA
jgi:hypothetical protein